MKPSAHKSKHVAPDDFVVFYTAEDHVMDFCVVTGLDASEINRDADNADIIMDGYIKWDGCINVDIEYVNGSVPLHFCGLHGALVVERAMRAIYALAAQHVARFDSECAK